MGDTLEIRKKGLYCPAGRFYIDPVSSVPTAVVTHAHADHLRWGHKKYHVSTGTAPLAKKRLEKGAAILPHDFGDKFKLGKAWVSFHPAGHILGSAQVRVEVGSSVWVVSGDYKRTEDASCEPFEPVTCDTFITEATFALPIYQWRPSIEVAEEIFHWWQQNASEGFPSLLCCYALGKAQRITGLLRTFTKDPIYLHGAAAPFHRMYQEAGIALGETLSVSDEAKGHDFSGSLILAPASAFRSSWMKRFKGVKTGFASGWMQVRGNRRRQGYDRGFVLSDHADWDELIQTCRDTKAKKILATHGNTDTLSRYLSDVVGIEASPLGSFDTGEEE